MRAIGDGTMSDNWVGPGWWMASDGKWYPPRTPAVDQLPDDGETTRWSRRTADGNPVAGATMLTSSEARAEEIATRRERAANIPRPEPVSIKRVEEADDEVVIDLAAEVQETIDLRDNDEEALASMTVESSASTTRLVASTPTTSSPTTSPGWTETSVPSGTPVAGSPDTAASTPRAAEALHEADVDAHQVQGSDTTAAASGLTFSSGGSANDSIWNGPRAEQEDVPSSDVPLRHAVLPAVIEQQPRSMRGRGLILLALATGLAVLSGVLGSLWLRERSEAEDLRAELARVEAADVVSTAGLTELGDEVRTLTLQNEQLETRLDEMSALALELPEGRVTEIAVPFTPIYADEENDRFIAVSAAGEYVVWSEGAEGAITDSGQLTGGPTGVFAATSKAWIATDTGTIEIVSLVNGEGLPTVAFGPVSFMAPEERAYWTYDGASGEVVRLKKGDGSVTAAASVPVPVVDLTIGAGSVWALGDDGRVYRINTADFTVQAIDAGADLISVTAGPDALWTLSAADGSLRRVDAVSGEVLVTVPVGRDPIDATFAGSSVWVALRSGTSLIEVDTRTAAVVSRTALPGTPTALHQGDSGVFVTLEGDVPLVRVASLIQPPEPEVDEAADDVDAAADDAG